MRSLITLGVALAAVLASACSSDVSTEPGTTATGAGAGAATSDGAGGAGGSPTGSTGAGGAGATTGSGGAGASGTGGAGGALTCPSFGDACTACLADQCAARYCDCYGNLACQQLLGCLNGCPAGGTGCQQMCLAADHDGISSAFLLGDCAAAQCAAECPGNQQTLTPCQTCLYTDCAPAMNSCVANPACVAAFECLKGCGSGDTACQSACVSDNPGSGQDVQSVGLCLKTHCTSQCS